MSICTRLALNTLFADLCTLLWYMYVHRTSLNCPLPSTVDLPMHILNTEVLGFMVKPEDYESLDHAAQDFLHFKLENLGKPLPLKAAVSSALC